MSEVMRLCDDNTKVECADCDWTGTGADLDFMPDFEDRVTAGEIAPAGQCPECGCLAHVVEQCGDSTTISLSADELKRAIAALVLMQDIDECNDYLDEAKASAALITKLKAIACTCDAGGSAGCPEHDEAVTPARRAELLHIENVHRPLTDAEVKELG